MFETAFNNIDRALRTEEGCASELDYAEQTSWILFLKYLEDRETAREDEAALEGTDYAPILRQDFRWSKWAAPKTTEGEIDRNAALTGDDLITFVNGQLFPYLAKFKASVDDFNTVEYKIGQIFSEVINKFRSGYVLRDVIDIIDGLNFNSQDAKHELSDLYESRIKRMGNAGRNGGEYYTPRPLIRAMIKVIDPKIGETVYDGAVGSAGFLCEAYDYMAPQAKVPSQREILQDSTFYGQEKKSLAYVIGIMNMVLHGIDTPNIVHTNTLNQALSDIQPRDQHDVILANPPFGSGERAEVQQNFPIRSGETAYLFMQHFMRKLKPGGRAAIVIKSTFLSNVDNASIALRKELLEEHNLYALLNCPTGTFQGAGVQTVVLFFEKGAPTRRTWYYALEPGRNLGKTNPLNDHDLAEFLDLQPKRAESEKSWTLDIADVDPETWDLSAKNPNAPKAEPLVAPDVIIADMLKRDDETRELLLQVRALV